MNINFLTRLLSKHPFWRNVEDQSYITKTAATNLAEKASYIELLNGSTNTEISGGVSLFYTEISLSQIDEMLNENEYLKEFDLSDRIVIYLMAQQKVSEFINNHTIKSYYDFNTWRPEGIIISPIGLIGQDYDKHPTGMKLSLLARLKKLLVWTYSKTLTMSLDVYTRMIRVIRQTKTLSLALEVYTFIKEVHTAGHTISLMLAVYTTIKEKLAKAVTLTMAMNVYTRIKKTFTTQRDSTLILTLVPSVYRYKKI